MSEYTLKDINKETVEVKEKEGDKKIEYIIEYKNKDGKDKMEVKDKKGTKEVDVKVKRKVGDKEDAEKTVKVEIEYDKDSWFTHRGKITKVDTKEVSSEKTKTVGFSGISSFAWTFWVAIFVGLLALGGVIWWWIASSKKEDKEEESL